MKLTIDIPDGLQQSLELQLGPNLDQAAKEAVAIEWYRDEKLSIGQVAELLGLSIYEAEGWLKRRGVEAPYSMDDFQHDRETLNRLLRS